MNTRAQPPTRTPATSTRARVLAAAWLLLLPAAAGAFVGSPPCGNNSPARPVPQCRDATDAREVPCNAPGAVRLWPAGFRPGKAGQPLPPTRDSTQWTSTSIPGAGSGHELFHSLDVLGNKLYVTYNAGFQIWDLGRNAEDPSRHLTKDGWRGDFLDFPATGENDFYVDDVAVTADGGRTLIALSGRSTVGFSAWEYQTSPRPTLRQLYQDRDNRSQQVRVIRHGGTVYAFAAGPFGVFVYDMSAARALPRPCLDRGGSLCPGIFRGKLGTRRIALHLDVIRRGGATYVASSGGPGIPVEIWEIADPADPETAVRRFSGPRSGARGARGLAFFEIGGSAYLGVAENVSNRWKLRIYRVDACLSSTGCGSLGGPLFDRDLDAAFSSPQFLTFSISNGTPFLYYGANEFGLEGGKVELLLDLGGFPGEVAEITDGGGTYTDACTGNTVGYWGDYYPDNGNGLRNVRPMIGKFNGRYFYRAAYGVFDVHVRGGGPPTLPPEEDPPQLPPPEEDPPPQLPPPEEPSLSIDGPAEGTTGARYVFQASAVNCRPAKVFRWRADGNGRVEGDGARAWISWRSPGEKRVTVTNKRCPKAKGTANVTIAEAPPLPPHRITAEFTSAPTSPQTLQPVTFDASKSKGNIGNYSWSFGDGETGQGKIVSHAFREAGTYSVSLSVAEVGCANPNCDDSITKEIEVIGDNSVPGQHKLLLPHFVVEPGGMTTLLSLVNPTEEAVTVEVAYFVRGESGPFHEQRHELEPGGRITADLSELPLPEPDESGLVTGYAMVRASGTVRGDWSFTDLGSRAMCSIKLPLLSENDADDGSEVPSLGKSNR